MNCNSSRVLPPPTYSHTHTHTHMLICPSLWALPDPSKVVESNLILNTIPCILLFIKMQAVDNGGAGEEQQRNFFSLHFSCNQILFVFIGSWLSISLHALSSSDAKRKKWCIVCKAWRSSFTIFLFLAPLLSVWLCVRSLKEKLPKEVT